MSRRDLKPQPTAPENQEDRSESSCHRNVVSPGIVYQTVSYDADDEKSSGSSLYAREPNPPLQSPPRKKMGGKRKKPVMEPAVAAVEDIDQPAVNSSAATLVPDHDKSLLQ